jgi:hypothetical protein
MRIQLGTRFSRRSLLQVGYLTGIGLSLADFLRMTSAAEGPAGEASPGPRGTADAVIFIHLAGGPAHLDTLDMKPEAPAEERGEFSRIGTKIPGLKACEHLPKLAAAMDRFTLLRGISHSSGDHLQASQFLFSGNKPNAAVQYPAIGSVMSKERPSPEDIPSFVSIPNSDANAGFMGVEYAPFKTTAAPKAGQPFEVRGLSLPSGLTVEKFKRRESLRADLDQALRDGETHSDVLEGIDRFGEKAMKMILSPRAREAFDTSREAPAIAQLFSPDDLGQSCLLAARLVERGVRFVSVTQDGWDTHTENFTGHKRLLPPFDSAIVALEAALREKGLLERTLVVATGEFGRTPTINKHAGRDHWPRTMWTLMTGGGVKAGQLIGGTDKKGHGPDDRTHMKPDDLAASIYRALGVNHRLEYLTKTGRPVILVQHGDPIADLFV